MNYHRELRVLMTHDQRSVIQICSQITYSSYSTLINTLNPREFIWKEQRVRNIPQLSILIFTSRLCGISQSDEFMNIIDK